MVGGGGGGARAAGVDPESPAIGAGAGGAAPDPLPASAGVGGTEPEFLVIGAGAAGIAAARAFAAAGRSCLVLEAMGRVGGRAFTESDSLGAPFDHGASWLHQAGDNPLVPLARRLGLGLVESETVRQRLVFVGGRRATAAEEAALERARERFDRAVAAACASPGAPDAPLAAALPPGGGGDAWDATVAHREGPVIAAAQLGEISLRDYAATLLGPPNLMVAEGVGELLRRLAVGLPVRLGAPVRRLRWSGAGGGGGIVAQCEAFGAVAARGGCVVTVSTGALAAGGIAFEPALPAALGEAIAGLPLGLLTKVAFRAAGADRLGLPEFAGLWRQVASAEEAAMTWHAWPFGRDHLIGFVGGRAAWELARAGPAAAEAFARAELARFFGAERVARALGAAPAAVVTDWGTNPFTLGAYSHARPGHAGARAALAQAALAGGRLRFAGEACHARLAGTVAGAWESGEAAARAVIAAAGRG